ncbi:MAG TPA: alpha/beta fold hydrolase [Dehalococcoidia bacterium]|nr:alpha/beta fold hydrolase [Dehalococcoidia bacterium]
MDQQIRFCTTADGARLAYAVAGAGPPLVFIPGWVSHLEHSWSSTQQALQPLAARFRLVRYDKRGTGLSDRTIVDFSLAARIADFEAMVDHLALERFSIFATSAGGPIAMSYAATHPDRVQDLVLSGTFARGDGVAGRRQTSGALASLVRAEWGLASAALTELFIPGAGAAEREAFASIQRLSAEADVAASLLDATAECDVTALLPQIRARTLVIHVRGDKAVPFEFGREVAAAIPGARLLAIEGDRHTPTASAERELFEAVLDFLLERERVGTSASPSEATKARTTAHTLSQRELQVLRLLAAGHTNQQIAAELFISLNTVAHHVSNIFAKAEVANRTQAAAYAHAIGLL